MTNSPAAIKARNKAYKKRHPSPVVVVKVADQMSKDIDDLLLFIEELKAAP